MSTDWLIDVDGVINASRPGWSAPPRSATAQADGREYRLRWEPRLIKRIAEIRAAGVNARWATTWCVAVPELRRVFGIDLPSALDSDRPAHLVWDEVKIAAAHAVLAEGRRLIWTDDTVVPVALKFFPQFREAVADGRALLIAPRPSRGLRPEDIDAIETFVCGCPGAAFHRGDCPMVAARMRVAAATREEILPEGLRS